MPPRKKPVVEAAPEPSALSQLSAMMAEWEGKKLFVAFPCYKTTNPVTTMCLMAIALDLGKSAVTPDCVFGDAMIYHSRNRLAQRFLASGCEWCLWVDDDMVVPVGRAEFFKVKCRLPATYSSRLAGQHVVHRLLSHNLPFTGGMYLTRNETKRVVSSLGGNRGALSPLSDASVAAGRVVPVDWMGSGCWLTHRSVFEAVAEKFPELAPTRPEQAWNFFRPLDDGRGEDQAFCARAKAAGVQPHLDLGLQCMHVGLKAYGWGQS